VAKQLGKLAQRYAKALFNAVVQQEGTEGRPSPAQKVAAAFSQFARVWEEQREFSGSMLNPMFDRSDRLKALLKVAERLGMPEVVRRVLRVIFEHERAALVPQIAAAFTELADSAAGVVPVEITVARAVAGDEVQNIEQHLRRTVAGDLRFTWSIDPSLIGGMIVKYQGKVVDGSLNSRLEQIERKLRG
jgi:F-type H+-transporting ATPase subunit delta